MPIDLKKRFESSAKFELILIFGVNLFFLIVFSQFDSLEYIYELSRTHENWEIDEVILVFITLTLSLAVYSIRRLSEYKKLYRCAEMLSMQDPLTDLYNRRAGKNQLEGYISEVLSSERRDLSIILVNIDNFKVVNNIHGNLVGDDIIISMSRVIQESLLPEYTACRWSGEEFLIICPNANLRHAAELAENIRSSAEEFSIQGKQQLTVSAGVASYAFMQSLDEFVLTADKSLGSAKNLGKNQVVLETELKR